MASDRRPPVTNCACACCVDLADRIRHGRVIVHGCWCHEYAAEERCGCAYCAAEQGAVLRSWHFGAGLDSVIVNETTTLTVDYDIGSGRRAGGARFAHVDGPALDDDALDELADDMQRFEGSRYVAIAPRFYRKAAA